MAVSAVKRKSLRCSCMLSLKQLVYCANILIFSALVVCYLIASLEPPVARRPAVHHVRSDVTRRRGTIFDTINGGQYRSNTSIRERTSSQGFLDFRFDGKGFHDYGTKRNNIVINEDASGDIFGVKLYLTDESGGGSHVFDTDSKIDTQPHVSIIKNDSPKDVTNTSSNLIRDIEAVLTEVRQNVVIDYRLKSRTLSGIWNALLNHSHGIKDEAVTALINGISNTELIRQADNERDLKYVENMTFLPRFSSPCWVEPIWPGRFYVKMFASSVKLEQAAKIYRDRLKRQKISWRMRCLPAFFLAGFPKCATTDLFSKLVLHPALHRPIVKEPHWWSRSQLGIRGRERPRVSFMNYVSYFDQAANSIAFSTTFDEEHNTEIHKGLAVDASASTIWDFTIFSHSKEYENFSIENVTLHSSDLPMYNISRVLPHTKGILLLRNPTQRAYSDFLYFHEDALKYTNSHNVQNLFRENIKIQIQKYSTCMELRQNVTLCTYLLQKKDAKVRLYVGMYYIYIKQWLKFFPRDSLLVIRTEDYNRDPIAVINRICQFLNTDLLPDSVTQTIRSESTRKNSRDWPAPVLRRDTREILDEFYQEFNKELSLLLGDKRFLWEDESRDK